MANWSSALFEEIWESDYPQKLEGSNEVKMELYALKNTLTELTNLPLATFSWYLDTSRPLLFYGNIWSQNSHYKSFATMNSGQAKPDFGWKVWQNFWLNEEQIQTEGSRQVVESGHDLQVLDAIQAISILPI